MYKSRSLILLFSLQLSTSCALIDAARDVDDAQDSAPDLDMSADTTDAALPDADMSPPEDMRPDQEDDLSTDMPDLADDMPSDMSNDMSSDMTAPDMMPDMVVEPPKLALPTIAGGQEHTCAIKGQELYCWGLHDVGQRGDGTGLGGANRALPQRVAPPAGQHYVSVVAGHDHSCGLTNLGAAYCWGRNGMGQLGDDTTTTSIRPVLVASLDQGVERLAAGGDHTCAILTGGALACWGKNDLGQIGIGNSATQRTPASVIDMDSGVTDVALGNIFTCAVKQGDLYCWGGNQAGQLGQGRIDTAVNAAPALTLDDGDVVRVAAKGRNACALLRSGALKCWGDNMSRQVGDPNNTSQNIPVPTQVADLDAGVTHVALTEQSACAIKEGAVYCWGADNNGQLATDAAAPGPNKPEPQRTGSMTSGATDLGSGADHLCALHAGQLKCWGSNATIQGADRVGASQLGQRAAAPHFIPGPTLPLVPGELDDAQQLTAGLNYACALRRGEVLCWGKNNYNQLGDGTNPNPAFASTASRGIPGRVNAAQLGQNIRFVAVDAGDAHACAITEAGALACWGGNSRGQLGVGDLNHRPTARAVATLVDGVTQVSAGGEHTCAIRSGRLYCWGSTGGGRLGVTYDNASSLNEPQEVADMGVGVGVKAVAAGGAHTCAINAADQVYCWGTNTQGQLGLNSTTNTGIPTPVIHNNMPLRASAIGAGAEHTCAIERDTARILCWGQNATRQLSIPQATTRSPVPVAFDGNNTFGALSVGANHVCATLTGAEQGALRCWGANAQGQVGSAIFPAGLGAVAPMRGVWPEALTTTVFAAGAEETYAVLGDKLWSWGRNGSGQLTTGQHPNNLSTQPLIVPLP